MAIKAQEVFVTTDGKQFLSMDEATAHQSMLDNAEVVEAISESFVNITSAPGKKEVGLVGRTRAFNKNVCAQTIAFLIGAELVDADVLASFEAILPSEELQARLDEEAAKVEAAKKAKESKEEAPVVDAEASADLFDAE